MKFKDKDLSLFWEYSGKVIARRFPPQVRRQLYRKLQMLDAARELRDLRIPPGNRLEPLKGDRQGAYSIRVNGQYLLCFIWVNGEAEEVEFCDYH